MIWLLLAILAVYAMLCDVFIQVDMQHDTQTQARLHLQIGGLRKTWLFRLVSTDQGHRLIMVNDGQDRPVDIGRFRSGNSRLFSSILQRSEKARRYILSHIHLERLDALVLLRTGDAARSAVLAGTAQTLLTILPVHLRGNVRIQVLPEFFRAHSTLKARCIIRLRLGTIILTAGMLLAAWLNEQHLTESEATTYGTSHR